jgi:Protein of unknown function (DUF3987)
MAQEVMCSAKCCDLAIIVIANRCVAASCSTSISSSVFRGLAVLASLSAEGGSFVGGHGLSRDNKLKTAAYLSALWDGSAIDRTRAGEDLVVLRGKRLAAHLMMQPSVAELLAGVVEHGLGAPRVGLGLVADGLDAGEAVLESRVVQVGDARLDILSPATRARCGRCRRRSPSHRPRALALVISRPCRE